MNKENWRKFKEGELIIHFEEINDVRDFQTTGVVAAARGCPFQKLKAGRLEVMGKRVAVREEYRQNYIKNINLIVRRMNKDL